MTDDEDDFTGDLRTAEDIANARQVVYIWRAATGNVDSAERQLNEIWERAVELGLEEP